MLTLEGLDVLVVVVLVHEHLDILVFVDFFIVAADVWDFTNIPFGVVFSEFVDGLVVNKRIIPHIRLFNLIQIPRYIPVNQLKLVSLVQIPQRKVHLRFSNGSFHDLPHFAAKCSFGCNLWHRII
jgi:hypothetical protein